MNPLIKTKDKSIIKFVFIFNLIMNLSNNYVFDIPQAMENYLIKLMDLEPIHIELLYSVYAIPNLFLALIGGIVIAKVGLKWSAVIFPALIFYGNFLLGLGIYFRQYWLLVLGRALFGIGGENTIIVQATIAEFWFSGTSLSFVMGLNNACSFGMISVQNYVSPMLSVEDNSLNLPMLIVQIICLVSFLAGVAYYFTEVYLENKHIDKIEALKKISESNSRHVG